MNTINIKNFVAKIDSVSFHGIESNEIARVYDDLSNESDRNAVIVATSIIDDILSAKLKTLLKAGSPRDHNALFTGNGPFGNMYSKVEWLYCTGELSVFTRKDINIIRKIRNDAAHVWRDFQLSNDQYMKLFEKMSAFPLVNSIRETIAKDEKVPVDSVLMDARVCFNLLTSYIIVFLGFKSDQPLTSGFYV